MGLREHESRCTIFRFKKALFRHQDGASAEWDVEESVEGPHPSVGTIRTLSSGRPSRLRLLASNASSIVSRLLRAIWA